MSGIQQMLLAAGRGIVSVFSAWDVVADNIPGAAATATFTIGSNGSASGVGAPNNLTIPGSLSWYVPNVAGVGNNFWVRFTPTIGTLTTNDAPGFTALSSSRSVTKTNSAGSNSCTFTIDIASDAGGANIVLSASSVVRNTHT